VKNKQGQEITRINRHKRKINATSWLLGGLSSKPYHKNVPTRTPPKDKTGRTVFLDKGVGREANKEMIARHDAIHKNIKDERTRREKVHKTRVKAVNKQKRGLSKVLKKNWKIIW
jgi:hypothetical protein